MSDNDNIRTVTLSELVEMSGIDEDTLIQRLAGLFSERDTALRNEWRETVRDIYDLIHLGEPSVYDAGAVGDLPRRLCHLIEERHPGYFNEPSSSNPPPATP